MFQLPSTRIWHANRQVFCPFLHCLVTVAIYFEEAWCGHDAADEAVAYAILEAGKDYDTGDLQALLVAVDV